jgi:uncharacterized protein
MIPAFPEFAPLTLCHRPDLEAYLGAHPPLASEYTFTNLYAWRRPAGYKVARFGAGFLLLRTGGQRLSMLQPLVPDGHGDALLACAAYLEARGAPVVFERVGEDFLEAAGSLPPGFTAVPDEDQYDYVYDARALMSLDGPQYHAKKNLLYQFRREFDYRYRPLTRELLPAARHFAEEWCRQRNCEENEGLEQESDAVMEMLAHFSCLSAVGAVLEVEGEVVALALGEMLSPHTFVVHVEKARVGMTGIYQALNCEFLRHAVPDALFVNREQDMGVPGLRRAKQSYHPVRMVRKYRVVRGQ